MEAQKNKQNNTQWYISRAFPTLIVLAFLLGMLPQKNVAASAIINNGGTPPAISSSQITTKLENSSSYLEPTNTFTDGTLNYYLVTQDPAKASWASLDYNGTTYPLTKVFVGDNLTTMKIGSQALFTHNGPLVNATLFFDDGIYTDHESQNYVGISQTNASYIGLNKTAGGEPAVTLRRLPRSDSNAAINNTMERYNIYSQNIYFENLIFDGQGYDMYPTGGSGLSKNRGEYMFYFAGDSGGTEGSAGFVMKDCILENIGASNEDTGFDSTKYNKNLAMNFYKSGGQHNFENIIIRNVKTTAPFGVGLGIISSNQSKDNYFKNVTIVADGAYNSLSRSIKIENVSSDYYPESQNSAVFTGTLSLPTDSYHNHIYIQSWNYDNIIVPTAFRYAQYNRSNGNSSGTSAIQVYPSLPAVTANKSILDLQDDAWLVPDGTAVSLTNQLATIATTINNAGSHAPGANIKIAADSASKINSFSLPNFGASRLANLVAVPTTTSLFTSTALVPFSANGVIQFPTSNAANIVLYNFDFDSLAKYTLQEAITGITAVSSITDPNDGSISGYPDYSSYGPSTTVTAKFKNATTANFSNSVFTSLVNEIKINNPITSLSVGSSYLLTGSLASTLDNSFTGSAFSGTITNTADDQTIYWYSSDPTIASVDRITGLLTGMRSGTVTLFAKAADANNAGEIEKPFASFTLTVGGSTGGTGGGGGTSETTATLGIPVTGLPIPLTGFTPGKVTQLPAQTTAAQYQDMDQLWLEIPGLNLQSTITGVPQTNAGWDVSWLGKETGWLNGTAFPTYPGNSVLTAHVYDANGLPGPFTQIDQLKYGDPIIVHAWNQQYVYEVREVKSISPNDSGYVFQHQDNAWLTLVTCQDYNAQTDQYAHRLVVRAVLVTIK
jgi:LPXTG-site transpeptidase (sortase) family protein